MENPAPDLTRIREIMSDCRDLPADLTDASLVALAERLRCTEVATTEQRDFAVYRPIHVKRLSNPIM